MSHQPEWGHMLSPSSHIVMRMGDSWITQVHSGAGACLLGGRGGPLNDIGLILERREEWVLGILSLPPSVLPLQVLFQQKFQVVLN